MRTRIESTLPLFAAMLLGAGTLACSDANATAEGDFARDLQLASTSVSLATAAVDSSLLTSLETKPAAAPEQAKTLKKAPEKHVMHSPTPTVHAAPVEEVAMEDESEVAETVAEAPAPEESLEPVAVAPRPAPVPVVVDAGGATGDYGNTDSGGGIFGGGMGGSGGVVIRGGGVDGDNCDLHRGRTRTRGPIYMPVPVATMPAPATTPTITRGGGVQRPTVGLGGSRRTGARQPSPATSSTGARASTPRRPGRIGG